MSRFSPFSLIRSIMRALSVSLSLPPIISPKPSGARRSVFLYVLGSSGFYFM